MTIAPADTSGLTPGGLARRAARAVLVAGMVLLASLLPAAAQDGWSTGEVTTGENFRSLWLVYSENGRQGLGANCWSNESAVQLQLPFVLADTGEGASIALQLQAAGASAQLSGRVATYAGNAGNATGSLPTASPIVTALASADQLTFGVPGQPLSSVPLASGRQAISTFVGNCAFLQSGGGQQAAAPPPEPQKLTFDLQDVPQTAAAAPTADGPILGLWRQTGSNYMPCPNCRAMVYVIGGSREAGHIGGFATDSCLYGEIWMDGALTQNVNGQGGARIRTAPSDGSVVSGDDVSLQVNGSQLTISMTPAPGGGLVGTIVETYQKVAGPEGLTTEVFKSFQTPDGLPACARYPQGAELAVFGQGGGAAAPDAVAQAPVQDEGLTAGEVAVIGGIATGLAIVGNEIADQFFTEAPAPDAPDGDGRRMTVTITSVRAVETTFGFGGDEIFLLFSDGTRFPANAGDAQSIDAGETWAPNASVLTSGGLSVDLREWDSFNASDIIGNLVVEPNRAPGRYSATLRGDRAEYVVDYEVSRSGRRQAETGGGGRPPQPRPQPQPDAGPSRDRTWTAHNAGAEVTVTDCRDNCEEDIGIILMCQGRGQPALVSVPWAAVERGRPGAVADLSVVIDGQAYAYQAALGEYGLVGHVPSFAVMPGDPLIGALQAGRAAEIVFAGRSTRIGLRGSRRALDSFVAECGWTGVATGGPVPVPADPGPARAEPYWFASQYDDFATGLPTTQLIYGVPETDAIGFSASCAGGSRNGGIAVDLIADFGGKAPGAVVPIYIQTQSYTAQYSGRVFVDSDEWAGIRTRIPRNDPIWQALQAANGQVIMGMGGGQPSFAGARGAAQAVPQFLAACAAATQPIAQPQPQPQPTAGGTFHFQCDDGQPLTVDTTPVGAVFVASMSRNGTAYSLIEAPGNVGRKFSNGVATLTIAGPVAQFTAPGTVLLCQAD